MTTKIETGKCLWCGKKFKEGKCYSWPSYCTRQCYYDWLAATAHKRENTQSKEVTMKKCEDVQGFETQVDQKKLWQAHLIWKRWQDKVRRINQRRVE